MSQPTPFKNTRRGEVQELKNSLASNILQKKKEAVKKVIGAMTIGKDVSSLFMDVLKCMVTPDLELKKLVYLYIINYAKSQPDLAILAVNTFRKDSRQQENPLLRALAVRTMGCIGVNTITEYLCDPLKDALNDQDPYVRKTATICVAKLYAISPVIVDDFEFVDKLLEMISDGNAMVVANAVAALGEIGATRGNALVMGKETVKKLLGALQDASEWSRIYILDTLAVNVPTEYAMIDETITRVVPHLSHANPAVVISTVKVLMKYMEALTDPEKIRHLCRKMTPPLVSLINKDPEIQYIALKNINIIIQKRPNVLDREIKTFFCDYSDPLYVKLAKLEIIVKLSEEKNIDGVLTELKDYAQEVDIKMVQKSVQAIGRCAIKLERAADRCMQTLSDLVKTNIFYIVQEAIIVMQDIFRKYPNKYESFIKDFCKNLKLDDPNSRAAIVWMIGHYVHRIENAEDLLQHFIQNFKEEPHNVQLQILSAVVKFYLYNLDEGETEGEDLVSLVLKMASEESDNPDLRDRGYIYWRLLTEDPALAKSIILCEKPAISEDSASLEGELLDKLVENIGMLSSVFYKTPEMFVGTIRVKMNERFDLENEDMEVGEMEDDPGYAPEAPKVQPKVDSSGVLTEQVKPQVEINLLDMLGIGGESETEPPTLTDSNLMPGIPDLAPSTSTTASTTNPTRIPLTPVLRDSDKGVKEESGVGILGAFQRSNNNEISIELEIYNYKDTILTDFAIQFNKNFFGLAPASQFPADFSVQGKDTNKCSISLVCSGPQDEELLVPFKVAIAIKCSLDIFYFQVPLMLNVVLGGVGLEGVNVEQMMLGWTSIECKPEFVINIASLNPMLDTIPKIIAKLSSNNIVMIHKELDTTEKMYFYCKTENGMIILTEVLRREDKSYQITVKTKLPQLIALLQQCLSFILTYRET